MSTCKTLFANRGQLPSSSYDGTLAATTRFGAIFANAFFAFFTIFYWLSGYPIQVVWLNLFALLLGLVGWAVLHWMHRHHLAAHLIIFSTYLSLVGPGLYTGGIESTALVWLVLIPIVAMIMAGRQATIIWGGISLATAITFILLDQVWQIDLNMHPPQAIDHFVDLASVILITICATWLNETIKLKYVIELKAAQQTLQQQARLDPLTESDNRRSLVERTTQYLFTTPNSILVFDIDHFKGINDSYGHSIGDQVLRWFSLICKANLRQDDILARLGGDEFVIFLPNTDLDEAQRIAERLRSEFASTFAPTIHGDIRVTISIGVATHMQEDNPELESLLNRADQALYQAKQDGRNRVCVERKI